MRSSDGLATVPQQQQPQSKIPSQAYTNYAMGPPIEFLFQIWAFHWFIIVYWFFGVYSWQVYVLHRDSPWHTFGMDRVGGALYYSFSCPPAIPSYSFEGQQSHLMLPHSLLGGEGSCFLGCVPPNDIRNSESLVGSTHGNLVRWLVPGWWIYCTWSVEHYLCLITHLLWVHGQSVNTKALSTLIRVWGLLLFGPSSWRLRAWSSFSPHRVCQHTRTGHILWLG